MKVYEILTTWDSTISEIYQVAADSEDEAQEIFERGNYRDQEQQAKLMESFEIERELHEIHEIKEIEVKSKSWRRMLARLRS